MATGQWLVTNSQWLMANGCSSPPTLFETGQLRLELGDFMLMSTLEECIRIVEATKYFLLSIFYCLLSTLYLLLSTYCLLPSTVFLLLAAFYRLPSTYYLAGVVSRK